MFLSDPLITERIKKLEDAATALHKRFQTRASVKVLLPDAQALLALYKDLVSVMPKGSIFVGNTERHLSYLIHYLERGNKEISLSDIADLSKIDLPSIREYYHTWLDKSAAVDAELKDKVAELLTKREFDSAIRRAFIVLTSRLRTQFSLPEDKDGTELVNLVFGSKATVALPLDAAQKQSYRDLFSGLYGAYRNKYAHNECNPDWIEVLGIISFINLALRELASLDPNK